MVVPVIDFFNLDGAERAATMAQIANGCEDWGFFQLVNHGIPMELLERVKKVCSECYRLREAGFKASEPVCTLDALVEAEQRGEAVTPVDYMDWEDIFYIHNGVSSHQPRAENQGSAEEETEDANEEQQSVGGRERRSSRACHLNTKVSGPDWV